MVDLQDHQILYRTDIIYQENRRLKTSNKYCRMAADIGDCATVLEQFIHDAANLPAEVNYMMEEIQALDKDMQKFLVNINSRESTLQKQVKNHGSLVPHPKEQEFAEYAKKHYDLCIDLQKKKIAHSDKACVMLDRQLKKLDERIIQLQRSGQMDDNGEPLPSVFNRKPDTFDTKIGAAGPIPLQAANLSALNASAYRANSHTTPTIRPPQPRQVTQVSATNPASRSAAPTTPSVASSTKHQSDREHSVGADSKRRKLTMSTTGINLPSQPSGLRQSSIGPTAGTPKAGTPTGSRAGSIPRQTSTTGIATKKSAGNVNKKLPHQQVTKLKQKHKQHARLSQSLGRKKGGSPSTRGVRGGTEASEDSVLSSADASDSEVSQGQNNRKRKRKSQASSQRERERTREREVSVSEDEEVDEQDDRTYCYCNQPSFGEMVGCENSECPREWFHIQCLGLKTVPSEEHWYCPECRTALEAQSGNKKRK